MRTLLASLIAIVCVGAMTSFVGCSQPAEEEVVTPTSTDGGAVSGEAGGAKPMSAEPTAE